MKYEPVNVKDFKGFKETKLQKVLNDFLRAEIAVAELIWTEDEYRNASSAYSAVKAAIKRFKHNNINVRVSEKRLYLFNVLLYEQELNKGE